MRVHKRTHTKMKRQRSNIPQTAGQRFLAFERVRARWLLTRETHLITIMMAMISDFQRNTPPVFGDMTKYLTASLSLESTLPRDERFPMSRFESKQIIMDVSHSALAEDYELRLQKHNLMVAETMEQVGGSLPEDMKTAFDGKRAFLIDRIQELRADPLGKSATEAIADERMRSDLSPIMYADMLKRASASILDLLYIILNAYWIELDQQQQQLLQQIEWYDRSHLGMGLFMRSKLVRVSGSLLFPLIEHFIVVRKSDLKQMATMDMIVAFCNVCRDYVPTPKGADEIVPDAQSPQVKLFTEAADGVPVYGLYARREYPKGKRFICRYGGVKLSQDPALIWDNEEEVQKNASAYTVGLHQEKLDDPAEDWIVDGELFWALKDKGRFINQAYRPEDVNCKFWSQAEGRKINKGLACASSVVIETTRRVEAGEQFFADYGRNYICKLMPEDFVPLHLLPLPLEACIVCKSNEPVAKCGAKCGQLLYCGQACADKHWKEHKHTCGPVYVGSF